MSMVTIVPAGVVAVLVAAISTAAPVAAAVNAGEPVSGTSWSGQCQGMQVGTYTFTFSPRSDIVTIDTPNGPAQAGFTVTKPSPFTQVLTVGFNPIWHGGFVRDMTDLDWTFQIGARPRSYYCALTPTNAASKA
jgi:hypothetical protein